LAAYLRALREEPREWVQREILAQCVRCLKDLGRIEQAGDVFLSLVQRDPATRHFGRIPLGWQTGQPSGTLERKAQEWMQDSQPPAARLIGASWLLPTRHRAQAIEVLRGAAARGEASIAALAEAQLWRTRVAMADEAELQRWRGLIEQMPRELRAGPYYTLAQGLAARGQHQQAALAWMRVPILHADDDRALAAAALLSAAGQLERIGEPPQAVVLYREIVRDYAGTPSSGQARAQLERLAGHAGG
jgi:tetratricopeptide (TPR) repeat protein